MKPTSQAHSIDPNNHGNRDRRTEGPGPVRGCRRQWRDLITAVVPFLLFQVLLVISTARGQTTRGQTARGQGNAGAGGQAGPVKLPWTQGAPSASKLGWCLGVQAWSFHNYTFFEAVDKAALLGLHYIEAYPGQPLSPEHRKVRMGPGMGREFEKLTLEKLKSKGVKLVNFGVTGLPNNEQGLRRIFEWARRMGIETIVSEAPREVLEKADPLCSEYGINIALHNHPKPRSRYWNPATILEVCNGLSSRIGACCDTGHWMRSGIRPLDGVRMLKGRIISFHFKDLNRMGPGAHDVPWGTGSADLEAVLRELKKQGFRGVFSIEYEYHWNSSLPEISQCVEWFEKTCRKLLEEKE